MSDFRIERSDEITFEEVKGREDDPKIPVKQAALIEYCQQYGYVYFYVNATELDRLTRANFDGLSLQRVIRRIKYHGYMAQQVSVPGS